MGIDVTSDMTEADCMAVIGDAFSSEFYLERYPDIKKSGADPLLHYVRHGWKEGRDPSPVFSSEYYLQNNKDVADSGVNPLYHYITTGLEEGRRPLPLPPIYTHNESEYARVRSIVGEGFDSEFYVSSYPKSISQMRDPLDHFLFIGWSNGFDPCSWFSVTNYAHEHKDVLTSGVNPFYHYLVLGRLEENLARLDEKASGPDRPEPGEVRRIVQQELDREFYLFRYPDVRDDGMDPVEHYLSFGWQEGRDPNPDFSTTYYLQANPDVREKGINPLYHYTMHGRHEGRLSVLPGGHVARALHELKSLEQKLAVWMPPGDPDYEIDDADQLFAILEQALSGKSPRLIVSFSHDDYTQSVGGVQICIMQEQMAFVDAGATYLNLNPVIPMPVFAREHDLNQLLLNVICNGVHIGIASAENCLYMITRCKRLATSVDLVVHALLGHSLDFVRLLGESAISGQSVYWLHDYQSICPGYNLLRNSVHYCGVPAMDSMTCSICVYGEERLQRNPDMRALFEAIPFKVAAPSDFAAGLWKQHADLRYQELLIQPHTSFSSISTLPSTQCGKHGKDVQILRIAFTGYPIYHKGWPVFRTLAHEYRSSASFEFHFFSASPTNEVAGLKYTPVNVGRGNLDAMINALANNCIDLAFIWSIAPETYCLTAHEAVASGAIIITNENSGNVARMVEESDCGFVFKHEEEMFEVFSSGEIFRMVDALRERTGWKRMGLSYSRMSAELL